MADGTKRKDPRAPCMTCAAQPYDILSEDDLRMAAQKGRCTWQSSKSRTRSR